ncbi:flagellar transcriptional regulator FlhD [Burkholderia sp. Ac-20365]|uniref:flagellar transcriptional regulator FlhD n=1 Tax=Burkholderia sp. Ac-20365 TaxID=2703897 RepID=UPI00197B3D10|nr:flagellar transcriptional regulator FlhD [Burkholderia sp. Ac-20365]MBN3761355.1 flagellar transcriptional regulator FlhD [Burkholderia sp. Ac-20365]
MTGTGNSTADEIRELNLSYLLLAQRMLREDKAIGMFRLGLSAQVADILTDLTLAQTVKLAGSNQVLCRFRFDDHTVLGGLAERAAKRPAMASTHSAIVLAGQPVEQIA